MTVPGVGAVIGVAPAGAATLAVGAGSAWFADEQADEVGRVALDLRTTR